MEIRFSKKFTKQYNQLPPKLRQKTKQRIELWKEQPHHPLLRHHRLEGELSRFYSINITGDIRALYEIVDGRIYLYEMIGTHSQLYG